MNCLICGGEPSVPTGDSLRYECCRYKLSRTGARLIELSTVERPAPERLRERVEKRRRGENDYPLISEGDLKAL